MRRLLLVLVAFAALAAASPTLAGPPPRVDGAAYLVADPATGEILTGANENGQVSIASITKLMTAIVTLEHAKPGDLVTVSARSSNVGESSIYLSPGERLTVRDLLAAALIQSANDSAFALAAYVGHGNVKAFVQLMNEKAAELGLENTHFVRPDGLDTPGHVSSASDVLTLAKEAMKRPLIRRLVRQRTMSIAGGRTLHTWNDLLGRTPGVFGVKTGHTDKAGWSEVAVAKRDGMVLYAVVLGGPSRARRNADLKALFDWGFDQYGRRLVVDPKRTYATAEVPFHEDEALDLVAGKGAQVMLPLDRPLVETVVAPDVVELPVEKGDKVGEIVITDNGRVIARRPLVASRTIEAPGFGERTGWYAGHALSEAGDMVSNLLGSLL